MFNTRDTIVAISSAAGPAARSIVRLSGQEAISLADRFFRPALSGQKGFTVTPGIATCITENQGRLPISVPARAYLFRGPRSYTRQDVVELHLPGEVVANMFLAALVEAGARPAGPGEFTARAFFSGRLDLSAAEAVADVIDAEADAQLRSAVGVMEGALARLCRPCSAKLTEALALTETSIDFADEGLEPAGAAELASNARAVADELSAALASAGRWSAGGARPRVAIAGRPNAGKSSLLNALAGAERAIVSHVAGTTRDVLSAPAVVCSPAGRMEIVLLDAAGLHAPSASGEPLAQATGDAPPALADPLAEAADAAARSAVASAEAVVFVFDASLSNHAAELALLAEVRRLNPRAPLVAAANKSDIENQGRLPIFQPILRVSALTGQGLTELKSAIARQLSASAPPAATSLLLHDRQRRAIDSAGRSAGRAAELFASAKSAADVAELASVELRCALESLAELTGQVATEDVLAAIFSRFCIGK